MPEHVPTLLTTPASSPSPWVRSSVGPLRATGLSADALLDVIEALDGATRGIAGILSFERVLQLIVDRVRDLVQADYAALGIARPDGVLEQFVTSGLSRDDRERIGPLPRGHGLLAVLVREARALRIPDIAADPRSHGFPEHHPLMRPLLGVPITVRGRVVGDLYLTDKRGAPEFSENDQAVVEMFALHAGIAIENARLHEAVRRLAVVEERERIGQDLHDGIIQSLYGLGLSLEDVPELMTDDPADAKARIERAIEGLHLAIRDIRNFIFDLRPERLADVGLVGGLATIADEFRLNAMVDVELETDDAPYAELSPEVTDQLIQIAREALSNVGRHAHATRAVVSLSADRELGDDERIVMVIADNGRGFDPEARRSADHRGLVIVRARVHSIGGRLAVASQPGQGTRIEVSVPRDDREPTNESTGASG